MHDVEKEIETYPNSNLDPNSKHNINFNTGGHLNKPAASHRQSTGKFCQRCIYIYIYTYVPSGH